MVGGIFDVHWLYIGVQCSQDHLPVWPLQTGISGLPFELTPIVWKPVYLFQAYAVENFQTFPTELSFGHIVAYVSAAKTVNIVPQMILQWVYSPMRQSRSSCLYNY